MQFRFADGVTVGINIRDSASLLDGVRDHLRAGRGFAIATLNVDHLQRLGEDGAFGRAYMAHDMICADGNPIVWLSRLAGERISLVPGSDLVVPLMQVAAAGGWPVALIGGNDDLMDKAGRRLQELVTGLNIVLRHAPGFPFDPDGAEADQVIGMIRTSGARLCLLALGAPRQERFAIRARDALQGVGLASIGAGLDFLSGHQRRAPKLLRQARMEWMWRMLSNPRRLAARYAKGFTILPGHAIAAMRQGRSARGGS
ncbi:WecB/TagA/CpsF family glycosyltransferase [Paracoccus sp. DMF-8]|uniref:WecB/TagA/CpsF family glycosyltransferase n=1 Tax=Paracoccus sp. DMF-8 TaxID=3019445 RepID=UPI0023E782D7|nr:WecB/TagA/CpsF family glycosyltransferase [Paracoccus sp. DMF-8]MDF3606743.1 WecB/TagA/CpsF family glycosyltransferase [Paracoccus sp. DMF-8]